MLMIPRAMPWARCFCPFRAYGADLVLFFSDRNGTDFLTEQEEDLVYLVESQRFLSLFQFSYES